MSARDLAAKSGVSASTVTRIERGEINPTVTMLERLLDASGNQLVVRVQPRPDRPTLAAVRDRRDETVDVVASFGGSTSECSARSRAASPARLLTSTF